MQDPELTTQEPGAPESDAPESATDELTPQVPGASPDDAYVQTLLAGNVGDVVGELSGLSDAQLDQAHSLESQGKNRSTVLAAIVREQQHRAAATPPEAPDLVPNVSGNRVDYRNRPATDVDPTAISAPVLTRDGWVVPSPKANPEG